MRIEMEEPHTVPDTRNALANPHWAHTMGFPVVWGGGANHLSQICHSQAASLRGDSSFFSSWILWEGSATQETRCWQTVTEDTSAGISPSA